MNREAIYAALFAKLSAIPGFNTSSRKLKHWSDVPQSDQPALFVVQKHETGKNTRGIPTKWSLSATVYVYANSNNSDVAPSQISNPLVDAIEAALAPDFTGFQTLGGLVSHAWIEGTIETSEGVLGDQEVVIIPVDMLAPI